MLNIHKLDFDIIFAQCYNSFPLGGGPMDIAKPKLIYELIERDLQLLSDKNSKFAGGIQEIQTAVYKSSISNSILFEQTLYYKKFLSMIANTVKEIGLPNNSISYSQVIENLIFEGYLSSGEILIPYKIKDNIQPLDLLGFAGIDVIRREGNCRHFSSLHSDIFHILDLYYDIFFCYDWVSGKTFVPPIDADYGYLASNHVANLIKYNGRYYIHDAYNEKYFYFTNQFTAEQYEKKGNQCFLYYSPVETKIFNNKSYRQILKQMNYFEESSLKPHIGINELNDIINETNDRFYNSTKILYDFREEALPYIKKIVSSQIKQ